jgi:hypothetical protein
MESSKIQETHRNSSSSNASRVDSPSCNDRLLETLCDPTSRFPNLTLNGDGKSKKDNKDGAEFTATNTIDTLTLDEQGETPLEPEKQNPSLANASTARKVALITTFTLAQFLDAFNNSALFPAIPTISSQLHFEASETVWIISAYQLTFAAFLLVVSIMTPLSNRPIKTPPERSYIRRVHTQASLHCRFIHSGHKPSHRRFHPPEDCAPRAPRSWWHRRCTHHPVCTLFDRSNVPEPCLASSCYCSVR